MSTKNLRLVILSKENDSILYKFVMPNLSGKVLINFKIKKAEIKKIDFTNGGFSENQIQRLMSVCNYLIKKDRRTGIFWRLRYGKQNHRKFD